MRLVVSVVWKTIFFLVVAFAGFLVGATVPALRVSHVVSHTATNLRTYDFDWLIALCIAYVLLLLIGILRRHMPNGAVTSTAAFFLTIAIIVLFTQLGVKDTPVNGSLSLPAIPSV